MNKDSFELGDAKGTAKERTTKLPFDRIEELDFCTRTCNLLTKQNIRTVGQLVQCSLKENRERFSASVLEACAQLREYSAYFDEEQNRRTIQS
jgi:DNA-directed RNA polymerase alpha subunit